MVTPLYWRQDPDHYQSGISPGRLRRLSAEGMAAYGGSTSSLSIADDRATTMVKLTEIPARPPVVIPSCACH